MFVEKKFYARKRKTLDGYDSFVKKISMFSYLIPNKDNCCSYAINVTAEENIAHVQKTYTSFSVTGEC